MIRWIRRHAQVPADTVEIQFDRIEREDGWTSEAGTDWPSETIVHYAIKRSGSRAKFRSRSILAPDDVGDFLREILEDDGTEPSG